MDKLEKNFISYDLPMTVSLGKAIGACLRGGEVIELLSDLGGGKTAFVRGLALGIDSDDEVSSPSFTINNTYVGNSLTIEHFDFYRLDEPGLLADTLLEDVFRPSTVVVVEWGDIVHGVLPEEKIVVQISTQDEQTRVFNFMIPSKFEYICEGIC